MNYYLFVREKKKITTIHPLNNFRRFPLFPNNENSQMDAEQTQQQTMT